MRQWKLKTGAVARVDLTKLPRSRVCIESVSQRHSVVCRSMREELQTVSLNFEWLITNVEDIVVSEVVTDLVGRIARGIIDILSQIKPAVVRDEARDVVW